ncbi:MAG: cytochrome c [Pseudomonadota bacterium]|nr:cytochrome c [Pseudomonadota bacterium]
MTLRAVAPWAVILAVALSVGAAFAKPDGTSTMPTKRPVDYEVGKRLWAQSCWQCHGESGKGDGPAAAALVGGVPSLEGKVRGNDLDRLVKVVQAGRGAMPAYSEDIDEHDTRRILQYLEGKLEGRAPPPDPDKEKDKEAEEGGEGQ